MCLSVPISIDFSVCPSLCPSLCYLPVCRSLCLCIHPSIHSSVAPSLFPVSQLILPSLYLSGISQVEASESGVHCPNAQVRIRISITEIRNYYSHQETRSVFGYSNIEITFSNPYRRIGIYLHQYFVRCPEYAGRGDLTFMQRVFKFVPVTIQYIFLIEEESAKVALSAKKYLFSNLLPL